MELGRLPTGDGEQCACQPERLASLIQAACPRRWLLERLHAETPKLLLGAKRGSVFWHQHRNSHGIIGSPQLPLLPPTLAAADTPPDPVRQKLCGVNVNLRNGLTRRRMGDGGGAERTSPRGIRSVDEIKVLRRE